jgi:hypothetical protein
MIPAFSNGLNLSKLAQSTDLAALKLVYTGGQSSDKVAIYQIVMVKPALLWTTDLGAIAAWQAHLNGTVTTNSTELKLSTPPFETNKVYAEYDFSRNIVLQNNTFLIYQVSGEDPGTSGGAYVQFANGQNAIYISSAPGTYFVNVGAFAGQTPNFIFLYNILGSETTGTDASYQVTYSWVGLVTLGST